MRTTITIPDDLARDARELARGRSLSNFTRQALQDAVERLKAEELARELEEGYRSEAQDPSLDPAWAAVEVEDL
ncbi:MAG TPA: hypothetical protein VLF66_10755 [Thermoanaerobaculia bacterium]|nr:hypothetical protein [Thermoanaerobaculia bacterium]